MVRSLILQLLHTHTVQSQFVTTRLDDPKVERDIERSKIFIECQSCYTQLDQK